MTVTAINKKVGSTVEIPPRVELEKYMKENDADSSGNLNKEEYVAYLRQVLKHQHNQGTTKILVKAATINFVIVPVAVRTHLLAACRRFCESR